MLTVLFATAIAEAWGPEGHRITGKVAERHLEPGAKQAIRELLDGRSLDEVANWADDVRSHEDYEWTRPLHYINVPRTATRVDMKRDCETGLCVVGAILDFVDVLKDSSKSREERVEALKFIVHFVGDIHQPMHVSYADDRGGNLVRVNFMGDVDTNLHRVWDSDILRQRIDRDWRELAEEILGMISDQNVKQWGAQMNPVAWANESLSVTRRIYEELPQSGMLDRSYYERNVHTVLERLATAGVRMAALLNDLLGDEQPVRTEDEKRADDDSAADAPDEPDEPDDSPNGDAAASLTLIEGEPCGGADGKTIYLRNTHDNRVIEVEVKQTWSDGERSQSVDRRFVLQPGERGQRRLGCSEQLARPRIREFTWEIIQAEFRD